mgnify:CR=1 FL=1
MTSYGAILLAGGRASRVDGATKHLFDIGGRTILQRTVDAVYERGCSPITIVAPETPLTSTTAAHVTWTREDPLFGGPVAGIAAALATWINPPAWTFLLACDLPQVDAAVARLLRDLPLFPADTDGVCLADPSSRPQWLTGVYRTEVVARGLAALPDGGRHASVRAIFDDAAIATVAGGADESADVDTWEDLNTARLLWAKTYEQENS